MSHWCTILVPLFNGEKYLHKFISSLHESADENCSCLFIDDASIDSSVEIISASRLPGMQLIRNERNLGLYATINRALGYVETEYVCLLFQDDLVENIYFQQMKQLVEAHSDASFLWAEITLIDDGGRERARGLNTGRVEVISPGIPAWRNALKRGTFWTISGSISKTARLRHHGFRPDLPHCGDYDFLLRAIREDTFLYLEQPLTRIRIHAGQASTDNLKQSIDFLERTKVHESQRLCFKEDFDFTFGLSICRSEMWHAARRALGQAGRGRFGQALSTVSLLPKIIHSTLF